VIGKKMVNGWGFVTRNLVNPWNKHNLLFDSFFRPREKIAGKSAMLA
jgi:hypothetical protein